MHDFESITDLCTIYLFWVVEVPRLLLFCFPATLPTSGEKKIRS